MTRASATAGALLLMGISALSTGLAADGVELRTVSSRPDMVSGGSTLVQLTAGNPSSVRVMINGQDVTQSFRPASGSRALIGRVEGLRSGKNTLEANVGGKVEVRMEIIDHPIAGPIFSGPHQIPFVCQTDVNGLGSALDADCAAKTVVTYYYKSTEAVPAPAARAAGAPPPAPGTLTPGFKSYDPAGPRPADVAQTSTSDGRTLDYIVRREVGTINRAVYDIEFLHQPDQPLPTPWTATPGWNGRLVYTFGGGCVAGYRQAALPAIGSANEPFLSQGYAVAQSTLNVFGNNCDDVISAETLTMVKEHFIKQFGVPVHTIGAGSSGGSMQQHLIAQNYPGLLDGILPSSSYPDITSLAPRVVDCSLLDHAFENGKQGWTDDQKTAVSGFATWQTCAKSWFGSRYSPAWVVATSCAQAIPRDQVYDPVKNPKGVRCTIYDNQVNVYGRDHATGFARRPLDNVGIQYGLAAFNAGKISAEQFVELNERAGGFDTDGNIVDARTVADPEAVRIAYQSGRVQTGSGGLSAIPIIDFRAYRDNDPDIHDRFRSFVTRARLKAANGNADNHVILIIGNTTPGGLPARTKEAVRQMDRWLDNIAKDTSTDAPAAKVSRNKPADLVDACWTADGRKIAEPAVYDGTGRCNQLYPTHADPRIAAGEPLTDDILKCALKPVSAKDYARPLTAAQMTRLQGIFPRGVCDYSRPGVGQQLIEITWQRFQGPAEPLKAASR